MKLVLQLIQSERATVIINITRGGAIVAPHLGTKKVNNNKKHLIQASQAEIHSLLASVDRPITGFHSIKIS